MGIKQPISDLLTKLSALQVVNRDGQTVNLYARIWNNNIEKLRKGESYVIPFPAAFVEVVNQVTYERLGEGLLAADVSFRIHLVHEFLNADGTFEQDLEIFDLRDEIIRNLQHVNAQLTNCTPLSMVGEQMDYDHDNLYHYVMDFVCNFIDTTGSKLDANHPEAYRYSTPPTAPVFTKQVYHIPQ